MVNAYFQFESAILLSNFIIENLRLITDGGLI